MQEVKGLADTNPEEARKLLSQLRGTLVCMPLHFLEEEELTPDFGTPESLAPQGLFTWTKMAASIPAGATSQFLLSN